jgi:hypothetical protein
MKTWVRKSLKVGILSAGFLLIGGAAAAQAASTSDNFGIGSGNQVQADIVAPISVSGNAIGLLGGASAHGSSGGGATAAVSGTGNNTTSHNFGILGGNQLGLAALLPVDVSGNAVGVGGTAQASGGSGSAAHASVTGGGSNTTSGNFGILGGNQVAPVIAVPIDVTGNAIGVLGTAHATGSSGGNGAMVTPHATGGSASGSSGIGSGNQILPVIAIPIDICGNAIGAFGGADASCGGNAGGGTGNGGYGTGTGTGGYGTGTGNGGGTTGGGYGTGTGNGGYGTGTGNGGGTTGGGYGTGTGTGGYGTGTGAGTGTTGTAGAALTTTATRHAHAHAHKAKAAKVAKPAAVANENRMAADEGLTMPHASAGAATASNFGILGGDQLGTTLALPLSVFGNVVGALGTASA